MLKELRAIWAEDQYRILSSGKEEGSFYFGHEKGRYYQIFLRSRHSRRRRLVQAVPLDQDWFWCGKSQRLVSEVPEKSTGSSKRTENIVTGISYGKKSRKKSLPDLSKEVEISVETLGTGAQVIWLLPKTPKKWLLSLHGGPESAEGLEIRYGGLYRELLKRNIAIAILNYRGSSNLSKKISRQAWGSWKKAIMEDFRGLQESAGTRDIPKVPDSILGVSFGGALALLLQQEFSLKKVLLSSPLLDIRHQRDRSPVSFRKWFDSRFSSQDRTDLSFESLTRNSQGQVYAFYSFQDEVLGKENFIRLEKEKLAAENNWNLYRQTGSHSPHQYQMVRDRFVGVLKIITDC